MVPKGWLAKELDEICEKVAVGLAISVTPFMRDSGVKLIRNQNIKRNYFDSSSVAFIDEDFAKSNKSKMVQRGDVVAVRTGSNIGEACVVPQEFEGALTFTTLIARPNKDVLDSFYLATHINSDIGINEVNRLCAGGGKPNLNSGELKHYKISTPPLAEQKKIAQILSTWDQAIATTERLLDLAYQQKKALMQQLLTGKKRFDKANDQACCKHTRYGLIPEDWAYPAIREICKQVVIKNTNQEEYPVLSCSKYDGFVDSLKYFNKKVYSDDTSGYRVIPRNCFGFPSNHIEEGSIGLQNLYDYGIVSPIYEVFRANENMVNNQYLIALLKTEHYRQIFAAATNASVDRRGSLRWKEFASIHVPLPPLEEQNKIAAILNTTNQEIETLQSQLDGLKQEKKALMQQLLTGKRRVQCALDEAEA
ncbi:restriction endonuclease subunit S [Chromobacterium haemolyticum]|uniref:restriction endonuclease subunit S n=1 Tax=Chromobacterium haemolyticum TaxID=394935 RepID=UPI000D2F746A|nr:restriction endonuclease subunit S [Chromobacterium haemolyticum]PTU69709.1 restriction endonuclease subunit S [Chromobacterium haemolyticum]